MIEDHDAPSTSRGRKRGRKSKVEPEATMIETFDEEGLIEESEESTSGFKLEVTSQEPSSTFKEGIYNQGNFYGWTKDWNPEWMYRLPGDVVLTAIRNGGSEGRGRAEIGKCLGIDTATKPGNRRVSGHIVAVQKEHEKHVGQFQKMEGKVRMIKYFWKKSAEPETFQKLFDDFRKLAKRECPFKMGQTIKFPDTGLSTLRISDVSLRRLNDILELLSVEEILIPIHKILKHIHNKEMAQGYQFQIDKKSMMKCLLALKKENLLNIFETLVTSENVENKIQIVTRPYISSADSPEVAAEIQRTIDLYHAEGRVFPHGQLRYSTKKRTEAEKPKQPGKNEINSQLKQAQELLENGFSSGISLEQRYALFRLQNSKSIVARPKSSDQMGSSGLNETTTNEDSRIDGIDNTLDLIANSIMEETSLEKENEPTENKEDEQIDEKAAHILLNCNGVLSDGVDDPSVPMRAIPKTLEHLVRKKDLYDPHIEYGFQSKYIRLCALHDTVWHFVYGNPRGKPSVFERYPPGRDPVSLPEVSLDQLPVYQETETPYRFMPSCDYEDLPAGWFMLQDFYCALPFSVFCLLSQIPKSAPKEDVLQLLTDPIARHTPLADLPISIRKPLFKDKRNLRQIEHTVFQLCAMGLGVLAPNPDPKRFTTAHTSVFYISKEGVLYDTSTSERGYAKVSLPLEQYNRYVYQFDDHNQVSLYWHHLRAISQSTPLNFRLELVPGEINPNRHKSYSLGMFDRSTITWDGTTNEITSLEIQPLGPHDGCAGFDSALYLHLKRHWDLSPRPNNVVSWFVSWFRRNGDLAKSTIEQRVVKLQRDWNSVVRSLMPSDMELTRKKRVRASTDFVPSTLAMQSLHLEPKVRIPTAPKGVRHKKRPLDNVDIISQQNRLNLRCRFSAKERDMLILIRAVGFFLNPVYRFWLDPSAVRDIMHEYVPESGTKTVQSLMAAGVRELVRPNRLAYLQRIVCNLNTFKEMRALRFQLASAPLSSTEDKVKFFKNAFNMANRLLFMEAQPLPSTSANDSVFEIFLASGKAIISSEQTRTQTPVPLRSQRPTSLSHIHHCTTTNVLLSVLIANANCDDQKPGGEYILEQLNPTDINSTLQVLRADGLIARPRVAVTDQTMQYKNQATLSHYFRHFFGHRFHVDLIEQINQIRSYLDDINDNGGELADLEDYAGTVLIATDSFYNKNEIELDIDDALIQMFTEAANQNSTKQIRYLESTDLHLERVHVVLTNPDDPDSLPTMKEITSLLDTSIPEDAIQARPLEEWLAEVFTTDADDKEMRSVTMAIQATEAYGVNLSDLQTTTNLPFDKLVPIIEKLRDGFQIIEAGVDTKRYVWHTYADAWTVVVDGKRLCPRPWIQPAGSICLSTARWMLEALLMAVVNKPGIQKKDLQFRFEFALQPVALEQLIKVLTYCECLVENFEAYEAMQFSGPFEAAPSQTVVHTLEPTVQAIQRFASIFRDVQPIHLLTSGLQSFATEDLGLNDTNSTGKKDVPLLTAPTPMEEI